MGSFRSAALLLVTLQVACGTTSRDAVSYPSTDELCDRCATELRVQEERCAEAVRKLDGIGPSSDEVNQEAVAICVRDGISKELHRCIVDASSASEAWACGDRFEAGPPIAASCARCQQVAQSQTASEDSCAAAAKHVTKLVRNSAYFNIVYLNMLETSRMTEVFTDHCKSIKLSAGAVRCLLDARTPSEVVDCPIRTPSR